MRSLVILLSSTLLLVFLLACQSSPGIQWPDADAPVAEIHPRQLEAHGDVRTDNYFWLRDRESPAVKAYLEAENEYTEAMLKPTKPLQDLLFDEFKARIKQADSTAPYLKNGYYYYSKTEEGKQYPVYLRKQGSPTAPDEVVLDLNRLAEGHDYVRVSGRNVTPDNKILAYAVDFTGRRLYTIHFRDLATGEDLGECIENVTPVSAWANDSKHFFYIKQDPSTLRWHQLWRHELGSDPASDVLIYEETDETFECSIDKTKSGKYLLLEINQTLTSEVRYLDAGAPKGRFKIAQPRRRGVEYSLADGGGFFYVRTNHEARNFRLMRAPAASPGISNWKEVIPNRDDVYLDGFEVFRGNLVLEERSEGLLKLRVMKHDGSGDHYLDFGELAYTASPTANHEFDSGTLRYRYTSLTTPASIYDYDMAAREKTLVKQDEVLGGFDKSNYTTERVWAEARDGAKIPVSLVYRNDKFNKDGTNPLLQYAYGSYGYSSNASFSAYRVSLLDRGWVYAVAHIRGGQEMGRQWYEDGKLLKKKNTFTDFIDAAEHLAKTNYVSRDRIFAMGGSAGGLLMGAVVNMRPDLWRGVIAHVPFVDVVTTMLDDNIPLTTSEYDEWGNPNDKTYYDYMLSYSPYDNVEAKAYPNMLVTTAFQDSQVQYWEPAKWVAKLRATKTGDNLLLLKTEMAASHGGRSGRDDRYRDQALEMAFLLSL